MGTPELKSSASCRARLSLEKVLAMFVRVVPSGDGELMEIVGRKEGLAQEDDLRDT